MGWNLRQKTPSHMGLGLWSVVLFGAWAISLGQSIGMTRLVTENTDPYQDIALYDDLRESLRGTLHAGFHTDFDSLKKTHSRFWRAQFAATPTILQVALSNKECLDAIQKNVDDRGFDYLLYEFKEVKNFVRFEAELREWSMTCQCEVLTRPLSKKIVLFDIRRRGGE